MICKSLNESLIFIDQALFLRVSLLFIKFIQLLLRLPVFPLLLILVVQRLASLPEAVESEHEGKQTEEASFVSEAPHSKHEWSCDH